MLSLDEFEQLLVGTTMASSSADDRVARGRMQRMFGKADLNKDGRVDFNEVSCATTQTAPQPTETATLSASLPSPPLPLSLPSRCSSSSCARRRSGTSGRRRRGRCAIRQSIKSAGAVIREVVVVVVTAARHRPHGGRAAAVGRQRIALVMEAATEGLRLVCGWRR